MFVKAARRSSTKVRDHGPTPVDRIAVSCPALPYPDGWFCLGFSAELQPGKVLTRPFMEEEVVLYRTRSGLVRAVRPYCPHLGAHLGAGGKIDGENLVCAFHGFAFGPDGFCVQTPYGTPPRAKLEHYTVREINGMIYVWYSHDGTPPTWEIPQLPEAGFSPPVHWLFEVATHPQEIVENTVDYGHLGPLHGYSGVQELSPLLIEGPFLKVNRRVVFDQYPLVGNFSVDQPVVLAGLGYVLGEFAFPRPGFVARVWFLITPIAPWCVHKRVAVSCAVIGSSKRLPDPLRKQTASRLSRLASQGVLQWVGRGLSPDLLVWNHKRYEPQPRLIKGDGPIGQFRHWARQFYPRDISPGDRRNQPIGETYSNTEA
jgi:nitrite reductase/ring-hydroxylating ferredoxin subunit